MSRIRSKKLRLFLEKQGAFRNPRELKRLKKEYRRIYQNQWARQQRKNKHEIRFTLNPDEYREVKIHCQKESITPTEQAKKLLLSHSKQAPFVANKKQLLAVAKDLGLAINRIKAGGIPKDVLQKLLTAETTLLNHLKI